MRRMNGKCNSFANRIFLYDDKMVITFNYDKGAKTITFAEFEASGILSNSNIASTGPLYAVKQFWNRNKTVRVIRVNDPSEKKEDC